MKNQILISKDSHNKCRIVYLSCIKIENKEEYQIIRKSGLLDGKLIDHTPIVITSGKVKRTTKEQATLEYNSHLKKYLDKGYKTLEDLGCASLAEFKNKQKSIEVSKTDQKGVGKPMLCKVYDKDDRKTQNIKWLVSRKLDGVRAFIYMKDGELHTSSRGGGHYDIAASYILNDVFIKSLFEKNPNLILDGELYIHRKPLNYISGLCRLEELKPEHRQLRFYCYDIADESQTFKQRLEYLEGIVPSWNSLLVMVDHIEIEGHDDLMEYHNKFVNEGYEGLVMRDPDKTYKFSARDRRMQKLKAYSDFEFEIVGLEEGLRREDFTFKMKTSDGKYFNAKPIGSREDKERYRNNLNNLIGQMATVKYFTINSDTGLPQQPIFIGVREIL